LLVGVVVIDTLAELVVMVEDQLQTTHLAQELVVEVVVDLKLLAGQEELINQGR
tara:strand:+ start:297 stop:458 length:162 start_codon:yes stop_codon:yes gene_type:complete